MRGIGILLLTKGDDEVMLAWTAWGCLVVLCVMVVAVVSAAISSGRKRGMQEAGQYMDIDAVRPPPKRMVGGQINIKPREPKE